MGNKQLWRMLKALINKCSLSVACSLRVSTNSSASDITSFMRMMTGLSCPRIWPRLGRNGQLHHEFSFRRIIWHAFLDCSAKLLFKLHCHMDVRHGVSFSPWLIRVLEGFHHWVACRISSLQPYHHHGDWVCPPIEDALEQARFFPIMEYISSRVNTLVDCVASRPILKLCTTPQRLCTSQLQWWWDRPGQRLKPYSDGA